MSSEQFNANGYFCGMVNTSHVERGMTPILCVIGIERWLLSASHANVVTLMKWCSVSVQAYNSSSINIIKYFFFLKRTCVCLGQLDIEMVLSKKYNRNVNK